MPSASVPEVRSPRQYEGDGYSGSGPIRRGPAKELRGRTTRSCPDSLLVEMGK